MSYENRKEQSERDGKFNQLKHQSNNLIERVGEWAAEATILHTNSPSGPEKADVLAMRQTLIDGVKAKLGI